MLATTHRHKTKRYRQEKTLKEKKLEKQVPQLVIRKSVVIVASRNYF